MKFTTPFVSLLGLALASGLCWAGTVNINTADVDALASGLNGVGAAKARTIVAYREQHGPFRSADELQLVKGIGQRLVDLNREVISVSDTEPGD